MSDYDRETGITTFANGHKINQNIPHTTVMRGMELAIASLTLEQLLHIQSELKEEIHKRRNNKVS